MATVAGFTFPAVLSVLRACDLCGIGPSAKPGQSTPGPRINNGMPVSIFAFILDNGRKYLCGERILTH
jgi:hypothetical protein